MVFNCLYNNFNFLWNMTMQDILLELSEYNVNCRINDGWFLIGVKFKNDWQVLEPTNDKIEFCERNGMQYYGAPLQEVSLDEVFECIKETIEHNKDLEKRLVLFQEKIKEMQELFKTEDYNTLKTLEFKIKKPKEKNDKKINKKDTKQNKVEIEKKDKKVEKDTADEDIIEEVVNKETIVNNSNPIPVDDGIMFVDTIAEMSNNKMNQNNYLQNTD